jgi:hypothetical protein
LRSPLCPRNYLILISIIRMIMRVRRRRRLGAAPRTPGIRNRPCDAGSNRPLRESHPVSPGLGADRERGGPRSDGVPVPEGATDPAANDPPRSTWLLRVDICGGPVVSAFAERVARDSHDRPSPGQARGTRRPSDPVSAAKEGRGPAPRRLL